ncbi:hypothetical protein EVAR_76597_1 [Eumeta japonica]|uniref:Uncharacterized protein n=1 Tax=Eumeta variegata TaxID=151549 RepID=A0A4C1T5D2_EUMVA|nr:hypothetical protein EVAR_76597_1 [Eumeta japonica]
MRSSNKPDNKEKFPVFMKSARRRSRSPACADDNRAGKRTNKWIACRFTYGERTPSQIVIIKDRGGDFMKGPVSPRHDSFIKSYAHAADPSVAEPVRVDKLRQASLYFLILGRFQRIRIHPSGLRATYETPRAHVKASPRKKLLKRIEMYFPL